MSWFRPPMMARDFRIPVYPQPGCPSSTCYGTAGGPKPTKNLPWWMWGLGGLAVTGVLVWWAYNFELNQWKNRIRRFVAQTRGKRLTAKTIVDGLDVAIAEISRKIWYGDLDEWTYQGRIDRAFRIADQVLDEEDAGWSIAKLPPQVQVALQDAVEDVLFQIDVRRGLGR